MHEIMGSNFTIAFSNTNLYTCLTSQLYVNKTINSKGNCNVFHKIYRAQTLDQIVVIPILIWFLYTYQVIYFESLNCMTWKNSYVLKCDPCCKNETFLFCINVYIFPYIMVVKILKLDNSKRSYAHLTFEKYEIEKLAFKV